MMEYVPFGGKDKIKLSVAIVQTLICTPTRKGAVCTEKDAIKFMMMCQAKALNPFEGDAFLIGFDGNNGPQFSLITAHQAFLKRAELHPEYDGMESGVVVRTEDGEIKNNEGDFMDEGEELLGGWARVKFRTRSTPMFKRINLSKFQKTFGIWQDNPATMIVKCAEADALRSSFPTMIGGMYLREEVIRDEPTMATPMFTPKEEAIPVESKKVETKKPEPPPAQSDKPIDILTGLLKKNNITVPQFIEALESAALCKGTEKLLSELDDETLVAGIDNFDKFVQIIQS